MKMKASIKEKLYARREHGITRVVGEDRPVCPSGGWVVRDRDGNALEVCVSEAAMRHAYRNQELVVFGSEL